MKSDRRAAIEAEIARRELASGVPPHLHVHQFRPRYSDEGGPRGFAPRRYVESSRKAEADETRVDRGLMGRLIERAIQSGEPIELIPNPSELYTPGAPFADYCEFGGGLDDGLMIFSACAAAALRDLLEGSCQRIPVMCREHDLAGYRLRAVEDVLDAMRCEGSWHDLKQRRHAMDIKSYVFFTEQLGRAAIFTVPQHWRKLVLQPFVDIVRGGGFTGFRFRKVWPHSPVARWD